MTLRKGMWVLLGKRVGILVAFDALAGEVHLVNDKGETVEVVPAHLTELRQARHRDIPGPRRPERSRSKALGYDA